MGIWSGLVDRLCVGQHHMTNPSLICYRLDYRDCLDEELVWALVQRHGGSISISPIWIDFYIDPKYAIIIDLAFPGLQRRPELDYV